MGLNKVVPPGRHLMNPHAIKLNSVVSSCIMYWFWIIDGVVYIPRLVTICPYFC